MQQPLIIHENDARYFFTDGSILLRRQGLRHAGKVGPQP
jgi:hypothetical protein